MKLSQLISEYIAFRKSLGIIGRTEGYILRAFGRAMGDETDIRDVQPDRVNAFLSGSGQVTVNWHRKHSSLISFYRYAIAHGHVASSPLPTVLPKTPERFAPYTAATRFAVCLTPLTFIDMDASLSRTLFGVFYFCFMELDYGLARPFP